MTETQDTPNTTLPPQKCYACRYRGEVPGSAHSCCEHPLVADAKQSPFMRLAGMVGKRGGPELVALANERGEGPQRAADALNIHAHYHGIRNGWFVWPVNFDPTWLETCDGFTPKEQAHG